MNDIISTLIITAWTTISTILCLVYGKILMAKGVRDDSRPLTNVGTIYLSVGGLFLVFAICGWLMAIKHLYGL